MSNSVPRKMSSEEKTTDTEGLDAPPPEEEDPDLTETQEVPVKKRGRPPKAKSEGAGPSEVHGKKGEAAGQGRSKISKAAGKRRASPAPPGGAPAAKISAKAPVHPHAPSSAPVAHVRTTKDILYDLMNLDKAEALHELEMEEARLTKQLAYVQAYKNALRNIPSSSEVKDASS